LSFVIVPTLECLLSWARIEPSKESGHDDANKFCLVKRFLDLIGPIGTLKKQIKTLTERERERKREREREREREIERDRERQRERERESGRER
jgi:hypothetical protein